MGIDDYVADTLPVNEPYAGLVAEAYDVWMPPTTTDPDVAGWRAAIVDGDGPALELGCGNGRLLVGLRRDGLDVEGVDASADMLAICAQHAAAAGVELGLHHADWTTMQLGRTYATIYNPAGSFVLMHDEADARRALANWRGHLRPGGRLYVSMGVPAAAKRDANYEWRLRRSGTRARDGMTFMVHEALRFDDGAQLQHALHRHEVWAADGTLVTTFVRRHLQHWWTRPQLEAALRDAGLVGVESRGSETSFVTIGSAPAH